MLEKISDCVFAYCFSILETLCVFLDRTHAVVGLGLPLLLIIAVHMYLPTWVAVAVAALVVGPAAAAMVTVVFEGLGQNRHW